jgi:dethiobiotin synthetase
VKGLTVLSTGPDVDAAVVAAALCDAATRPAALLTHVSGRGAEAAADRLAAATGRPLDEVAPHVLGVEASPLIAARHAGITLDPHDLAERARALGEAADVVVVAAGGGVLAPLTPRYSARDLAAALGLPVVLAVPAGPRAAATGLAALAAVRAGGLAAAAVVLTGWPEPAGRVDLDERALLAQAGALPVETLGAAGAAGWPVDDWAAAAAPAPATPDAPATPAPPARVTLDPYHTWEPQAVGDPRSTPRPRIMEVMLEIVGAEGPMTATRAYSLYNRAAGGRKLTSVARAPLSSSIYWLARQGAVTHVHREEIPWQDDDLVRLPDAPEVRVRELGPRALDEVPLDEIAALARRLGAPAADPATVKRALLTAYGLVRLTARADEYLGLAIDLAAGE